MPRECTVCTHPHRLDAEAALAAGLPAAQIAPLFGLPPHALLRHRAAHLVPAPASSLAPLCPPPGLPVGDPSSPAPLPPSSPASLSPASLLDHLRSVQVMTLAGMRAALARGDARGVIA